MATFTNASSETRYWFNITHPGDEDHPAGSTLILEPGESVDDPLVDGEPLPDDFDDPHLQPAGDAAVTPPIAGTGPGATAEAAPPEAPPEAPAPEAPQEA